MFLFTIPDDQRRIKWTRQMQQSFLILFFWDLLTIPKLKSPYLCCACWCTWSPSWVIVFWSRLVSWILTYTHPCTSSSATCNVWTSGILLPWLKCWANFILRRNTISFSGCAAQMYFSLAMGSTECVLLSVMAYDRYVAICNPLRYPIIMNKKICVQIAAGSWVTGSFTALVETVSVLQLSLCGSGVINHFTCEILAVLKLACVDTSKVQLIMLVISVLLLPMPMLLIFYFLCIHPL